MDTNPSSLETQLSGIKSLLVILNNNIEKTKDELKRDFKIMQQKIDIINTKLTDINQKIEKDLLKECKKMGSHIDFVENVYANVKYPLGYICKKIKHLAGGSNEERYTLTDNNIDEQAEYTDS